MRPIFALVVLVALVWGWIANIVVLTNTDFKPPHKAEVLRIVGIVVVPMGAVLGFMDLEDGEPD